MTKTTTTMDKYEAFEKLKDYSNRLSSVSYEEVYDLIKNGIKSIPLTIAKVAKHTNIDRARASKGEDLYKHIDELGYIKNKSVIDNHLTSFGRANKPHQVMFYGALQTTLIDKPRLTAIAEISHLFRGEGADSIDGEHYTVSRWRPQDEIFVVEVVFSEYALKNNPDIARSFERQKKFLAEHELEQKEVDFQLDFLKFISEEFSKKVENPDDYKISAAFTNIALLHPDVSGITYPSVQTEYFGINIVVPTNIVDNLIEPVVCSTQIVYKKGQKSLIANGGNYCDNIDPENDIIWEKQNEKILTPKEYVLEYLNDETQDKSA